MAYLTEHAFDVPAWLVDRDILRRVEQEGVVNRIRGAQASVINSLLSAQRMNRLVEYEALRRPNENLYTLPEMLQDTRRAVWTELSSSSPRVDIYRRGLQRSYLEAVDRQLNPPPAPAGGQGGGPGGGGQGQQQANANSDVRPALRSELQAIDRLAATALGRTSDAMTQMHLRDVRMEIEKILEGTRPRR
jgi:hypothetical protein